MLATLKPTQFNKPSVSLDNLLLDSDRSECDSVYLRNFDLDGTSSVLKRKNAIRRSNMSACETAEGLNNSKEITWKYGSQNRLARRNAFRRSEEQNSLNSAFIEVFNTKSFDLGTPLPRKRQKTSSDCDSFNNGNTSTRKISKSCEDILNTVDNSARSLYSSLERKEGSINDIESKMDDMLPYLISDINKDMRNLMIHWLIGITNRMSVDQDILYYSVSIMDRFLKSEISLREYSVPLPLLASSCLSLACKNRPKGMETNYLELFQKTTFKLNFQDVLQTEATILKELVPGPICKPLSQPIQFLRRYCRAALCTNEQKSLANLVLESALFCPDLLSNSAPLIAAASLFVALNLLGNDESSKSNCVYYTEHSDSDVKNVVKDIIRIMLNVDLGLGSSSTLYEKYSNESHHFVSKSKVLKREVIECLWDEMFPNEELNVILNK